MTREFSFDVSWLPLSSGPPAISATAASLTIRVGNQIATRNDDNWSKSIENSARLALYPSPVGWRIAGGVFVGNLSLRPGTCPDRTGAWLTNSQRRAMAFSGQI
jgi:hypothetical protein